MIKFQHTKYFREKLQHFIKISLFDNAQYYLMNEINKESLLELHAYISS